jgi:hypothetical protein
LYVYEGKINQNEQKYAKQTQFKPNLARQSAWRVYSPQADKPNFG